MHSRAIWVPDTLLISTAGLIRDCGHSTVTVEEILASSGVSRGAMFHHFPSKQALIDAVFEKWLLAFDADVSRRIETMAPGRRAFSRAYVESIVDGCMHARIDLLACFFIKLDRTQKSSRRWNTWMESQIGRSPMDANDARLRCARHAVDGLWADAAVSTSRSPDAYQALGAAPLEEIREQILGLVDACS